MIKELKFFESGMGVTEGTVGRWLKAEGDRITPGEVIVEMETAKAITEVSSPIDGVLEKILFAPGATAEVNVTLALLRQEGGT